MAPPIHIEMGMGAVGLVITVLLSAIPPVWARMYGQPRGCRSRVVSALIAYVVAFVASFGAAITRQYSAVLSFCLGLLTGMALDWLLRRMALAISNNKLGR